MFKFCLIYLFPVFLQNHCLKNNLLLLVADHGLRSAVSCETPEPLSSLEKVSYLQQLTCLTTIRTQAGLLSYQLGLSLNTITESLTMFLNFLNVYLLSYQENLNSQDIVASLLKPNVFLIIFGLSPHSPKVAAALQALHLCPRHKEEEGEHEPRLSSFIGKQKYSYYPYHHYPLQQISTHISVAARNFQHNSLGKQEIRGLERAIDSAKLQCLPYPKAENSTERIRAYPSLYAQHLAGFDTFVYYK